MEPEFKVSNVPFTTMAPNVCLSGRPDVPEVPDIPEVPDAPEVPDVPDVPLELIVMFTLPWDEMRRVGLLIGGRAENLRAGGNFCVRDTWRAAPFWAIAALERKRV
jgi:hypothetical protein